MDEKTTILYVDDELYNRQLFAINLRRKFNVVTAESGEDGLNKLEENPEIKVIFTDMQMPGLNGLQFLREARSRFPEKARFIITGFEASEPILEAINQKLIVRQFGKPSNFEEIVKSIDATVE